MVKVSEKKFNEILSTVTEARNYAGYTERLLRLKQWNIR